MRILVVDDDALDRLAVRRSLQQAGIAATVDEAASAAEALERVRPSAYDCVLLDYYMPGDDSLSLLRSMHAAGDDVPIVVFTGRGDEEVAVEFMKAGAVDYLPKASLSPERLATSFRYAMEMSRSALARRHAEHTLRVREAEFRTLANVIPQLAWMADAQGRRYWCNERWYDYTGLRADESLGLGWQLAHHPETRSRVVASQMEKFRLGVPWEETVRLCRRDGEYGWFLAHAMPVRDDEGKIQGWVGTDTDITGQKQSELDRERLFALEQAARTQAERATRARDDMLAIVAHDLRNPIQTISLSASMLAAAADGERRERLAGTIGRATGEVERLIADLLDVARIESGTFAVKRERVDLQAVLAEALERFDSQARTHGIGLKGEIAQGIALIDADRDRIVQVLSNLLANALRFTPQGGTITVRAASTQGMAQLSVEDTGKGIAPEHLPHIFDRFWQLERASRTGAGLGLAICKGIVEAHGGRIWATSAPGRGTTIHFTLPGPGA